MELTDQQWLDWRFGPAKYWYDWNGIPENKEEFVNSRYYPKSFTATVSCENDIWGSDAVTNFKSNDTSSASPGKRPVPTCSGQQVTHFPEEVFHLVNQVSWEDNIIWDAETIKRSDIVKEDEASWIPPSRDSATFSTAINLEMPVPRTSINTNQSEFESLFPPENEELVYGNWENKIIWDGNDISHELYQPRLLTLDLNDFNVMVTVPPETLPKPEESIKSPHFKRLKKTDVNKENLTPPNLEKFPEKKDPFNISNDHHYLGSTSPSEPEFNFNPKIRHSTPVMQLMSPFVPSNMSVDALQNFHRPKLEKLRHDLLSSLIRRQPIIPLSSFILKKAKERQKIIAERGTSHFFMDSILDISGRDGELILIENCEEHPPVLSQVGMCSLIKNYYPKNPTRNQCPPSCVDHPYGDLQQVTSSPFLGSLPPNKVLSALENNLYRCPIYPHQVPKNDFLLIRNKVGWLIRTADSLFTAGQHCPLCVVPKPRSAKAMDIRRGMFDSIVYRKVCAMKEAPKRLPIQVIKDLFPPIKNLQSWLNFRMKIKSGKDESYVVLKSGFQPPDESELQKLVTPEQCCALYSTWAGQQRLIDAGYEVNKGTKKSPQNETQDDIDEDQTNEDNLPAKLKIEVDSAPWNTTSAYVDAIGGKCLLDITGSADPTGCGEGFSYVRLKKVSSEKEVHKRKRGILGTDADLRLMTKNKAKNILINSGISKKEVGKLSRKEAIDMLRTVSTEKGTTAGAKNLAKFSRPKTKSSSVEFKENCQQIFELQNKILASDDVLSTDEESEDETDDTDLDAMALDIESLLDDTIANKDMDFKHEEMERLKLLEMMKNDVIVNGSSQPKVEEKDCIPMETTDKRVLKITRTYKMKRGEENITRVSVVRNPQVIDMYLKYKEYVAVQRKRAMKSKFQLDDDDDQPKTKKRRKF